MSERMHALAQLLTGKNRLEECTVEELQHLVNEYPYFAPARFLLLQKLAQENSGGYGPELQKSLLYYHNPLAFQQFIAPEKFYTELPVYDSAPIEAPTIGEVGLETPTETEPEQELNAEEETQDIYIDLPASSKEDFFVDEEEVLDIPTEPAPEKESNEMEETQDIDIDEPASSEEDFFNDEEEIVEEQEEVFEPVEADDEENVDTNLPRLKIDLSAPPSEHALTFEPFHTVDYFASQGIKPATDEKPKDKFGQQVRSFTDWLKVMKKLPAADVSKDIDPLAEKNVEHLAADSVNQADVVTEAMAEVWLKQGNRQKAIETYNKLILQNPSKKSFFAAKIEKLKQP